MQSPTTPQTRPLRPAPAPFAPLRTLVTTSLFFTCALLSSSPAIANNFNLRPSSQNGDPTAPTQQASRNQQPVPQPRAMNSRTRLTDTSATNPPHASRPDLQPPQPWVTPPQPLAQLPNNDASHPNSTPSSLTTNPSNSNHLASSNSTPTTQQANFRTSLSDTPATDATSTPNPSPNNGSGLILKPRSEKSLTSPSAPKNTKSSFLSILASLGIVIGLFLFLAWAMKRSSSQHAPNLPKEVIQVLGRTQIAPRQLLYVLRFGSRLVLVTQQAGQTTTLSEIEDPLEVDRIAGLCEQNSPNSISNSFREVFQQVASNASPSRRRRDTLS